jgi:CheY-like chemotaxis protein
VDDNPINLKVAEGLLAPYMMSVETAGSGREALRLVQERAYDLVFMDHMTPGMDGLETVAAIRDLGGYRARLAIVALTANAVSGARERFLENGFDDFLSKPIEFAKLDALLSKWIPRELWRVPGAPQGASGGASGQGALSLSIPGLDALPGLDAALGRG